MKEAESSPGTWTGPRRMGHTIIQSSSIKQKASRKMTHKYNYPQSDNMYSIMHGVRGMGNRYFLIPLGQGEYHKGAIHHVCYGLSILGIVIYNLHVRILISYKLQESTRYLVATSIDTPVLLQIYSQSSVLH